MPKFDYYGNQEIKDNKILNEIKIISNASNSEEEIITKNLTCKINGMAKIISLGKLIGSGGEGQIYEILDYDKYAVKLYHPKFRTIVRESKITLMASNYIDEPDICWPISTVYDDGAFVGFLMLKIDNDKYTNYTPVGRIDERVDFFKNDKRNMLKYVLNIVRIFEKLKNYNIVMGDVNPDNFLVNKETYDVIAIDMDGAQIDKYPCCVCREDFNAPEIFPKKIKENKSETDYANRYYHKYYSGYYRDEFALASYLFQIFMAHKPYQILNIHNDGDFDPFHNLVNRNFGYNALNKEKCQNEFHINRWSHLPYFIRKGFCDCFMAERPTGRLSAKTWGKLIENYIMLLDDEKFQADDPYYIIPITDEEIEFDKLLDYKVNLFENYQIRSFSTNYALKELINYLRENNVDCVINSRELCEYFKHKTSFKVKPGVSINLLYNIGVLKKFEVVAK